MTGASSGKVVMLISPLLVWMVILMSSMRARRVLNPESRVQTEVMSVSEIFLGRRSGALDEEAAFENGLEDVDESVGFDFEAFAEAIFCLAEDKVEVGTDKRIGAATDEGDENGVAALADESHLVFGVVEGFAQGAFFVGELANQFFDSRIHALLGGVTSGVMRGKRDEGVVFFAQEEGFFDLIAASGSEDHFVVASARHESLKTPTESVNSARGTKLHGCINLLGNSTPDGAAQHGFEVGVETFVGRVKDALK